MFFSEKKMKRVIKSQVDELEKTFNLSLARLSDKLKNIEEERKNNACPAGIELEKALTKAIIEVEKTNSKTNERLASLENKTDNNTKTLEKVGLFVDETRAAGWRLVTKVVSAVGVVILIGLQVYQLYISYSGNG